MLRCAVALDARPCVYGIALSAHADVPTRGGFGRVRPRERPIPSAPYL
jgi:hypothetical protein